jgi:hypothetical protein
MAKRKIISDIYDIADELIKKVKGTYKERFIAAMMELTNPDVQEDYKRKVMTTLYEIIGRNLGDMEKLGASPGRPPNPADKLSELCARSGETYVPLGSSVQEMCQISRIELLMEFEVKFEVSFRDDLDYSLIGLANALTDFGPVTEAKKLADLKKKYNIHKPNQ